MKSFTFTKNFKKTKIQVNTTTIMDILPPEILIHIFNKFEKLDDLRSCYNTCTKWKQIIEEYMEVKIFVATGCPAWQVEIINVLDPGFKLQLTDRNEYSIHRWSAVGGLVQNQPVICGGTRFRFDWNCFEELKEVSILGQPNRTFEMFDIRLHSSSVALLNNSKLWITGGTSVRHPISKGQQKSTELISIDQPPIKGPDLPFVISNHTMVQIDSKTVYIIGGMQNGKVSNKTWIVDPTNDFQIKEGPSLNEARESHSSAKMKIKGKLYIIVAGGMDYGAKYPVPPGIKKSVELLDTTSPDQFWEMGPDLPVRIYSAAMVTSPTKRGVILIGGRIVSSGSTVCDTWNKIIHLQMTRKTFLKSVLKWSYLPQKLQHIRGYHLAFPISTKVFKELKIKL